MIYKSDLWLTDINEILAAFPEISELAGKTVLITGAGGLICSALVDVLIHYNEQHDEKIKIISASRSEQKIRIRFGEYFDRPYFIFLPYDSAKEQVIPFKVDYIIHGASNADPQKIMSEPVETMLSNFVGLNNLLMYARNNNSRILYISSSEVYGNIATQKPHIENEYGIVDLLNPRSSYSVGKRAAETLCVSFAKEYGVDTVIARPGHIYGPTASRTDSRVSSNWAFSAAEGKDIVMKSEGLQLRSYCYCLDCSSALVKILLSGKPSQAYNISNPDSIISIKEMGDLLAKVGNVKVKKIMPDEDEKAGFNKMINSSLDSRKLYDLGWKGLFDPDRGFSHTVKILRNS